LTETYHYWTKEGFDSKSPEVELHTLRPFKIELGMEFKVWTGVDFIDSGELADTGETCTDVLANIEGTWIKIGHNVCFGMHNNRFGQFFAKGIPALTTA
jgi:hypothetical protein